jgi:SH3-like domain-containing protein
MKKLSVIGIVTMILFLLQGSAATAGTKVWVSSANAVLKADKSASSKSVENLAVGAELSVVGTDQKWIRVKTASGKEGWIYRGKVSDVKPKGSASQKKGDGGGIGGLLGAMTGSGISAKAADSSRSIRGLSPEAEEYAKQTGKPQEFRSALDSVLDLKIPDREIESFLKQGKIGEYAE